MCIRHENGDGLASSRSLETLGTSALNATLTEDRDQYFPYFTREARRCLGEGRFLVPLGDSQASALAHQDSTSSAPKNGYFSWPQNFHRDKKCFLCETI